VQAIKTWRVGADVYIAEWEWDDANVEHMAEHRIRPADVGAVWSDRPKYRRNRHGRAATHQMIGPDGGGRLVAAFIRQADLSEGRWRAITARPATGAESKWWELN